jgi:hypothetical protein
MKTKLSGIVFIFFTLITVSGVYAAPASNTVAIFYHANTPVNSDGIHFLKMQFEKNSSDKIQTLMTPQNLNPKDFKAVIVINSGLVSGIDPVVESSVKAWSDKTNVIWVNLKKNSKSTTVEVLPPSNETLGLDALTAASAWEGRPLFGSKSPSIFDMHVEWTKKVISFADKAR